MKTELTKIDINWKDVKNMCRNTDNKDDTDKDASEEFIKKILISEHSPIRMLKVRWKWSGIKSWISVHFARHWLGWEKWVSTQRTDRTGINRDEARQDTPVNMSIEANAQALINVAKWRLCYQASKETREYMEDLRNALEHNEKTNPISFVMVPNCVSKYGCPEFKPCGFFKTFNEYCKKNDVDVTNISKRYQAYNDFFKKSSED